MLIWWICSKSFSQQMINHERLDQVWLPDPITLSSTSFLIRYSIQTWVNNLFFTLPLFSVFYSISLWPPSFFSSHLSHPLLSITLSCSLLLSYQWECRQTVLSTRCVCVLVLTTDNSGYCLSVWLSVYQTLVEEMLITLSLIHQIALSPPSSACLPPNIPSNCLTLSF